ncbi:hypothetical protein [Desertibacillus haloalkaliphilus]|uniref:hypothetical protein n=1 Tax=Desertibacillus haloalkaliphilus TaxID=1328930 RepID=UPI001C27DB69|nr:hypothetical protein [Desertibacillus haloalkaliphilus]MBU8905581.1 hypothetical protein [Desertibacillus haloalkaliphilus]
MDEKIIYKIFEMKGLVESLVDQQEQDESISFLSVERLQSHLNECVDLITK